jgi:hypothetical protein
VPSILTYIFPQSSERVMQSSSSKANGPLSVLAMAEPRSSRFPSSFSGTRRQSNAARARLRAGRVWRDDQGSA